MSSHLEHEVSNLAINTRQQIDAINRQIETLRETLSPGATVTTLGPSRKEFMSLLAVVDKLTKTVERQQGMIEELAFRDD